MVTTSIGYSKGNLWVGEFPNFTEIAVIAEDGQRTPIFYQHMIYDFVFACMHDGIER